MATPVKKVKDWLKERSEKQFEVLSYFISSISDKARPYKVKRIKDDKLFFMKQTVYHSVDGSWIIASFCDDNVHIIVYNHDNTKESKWAINDLF